MKIFVIVVTYNPKKWIAACFSSLRNSSLPLNIIVVDNCSTDDSPEIIKQNYPEVNFIQSANNLGFGKANNLGVKMAFDQGADFVFLLNQDVWIQSDSIEKLVNASQSNPLYGVLSPIHSNGKGDALDHAFGQYLNSIKDNKLLTDLLLNFPLNNIYELPFVNAAAWLITRACIQKVGGFDPIFFHYGEDENYCQRVLFHGFRIGIVPGSKIFHDRKPFIEKFIAHLDRNNFDRYVKIKLGDVNLLSFNNAYRKEMGFLKVKMLLSILTFDLNGFLKWNNFVWYLKSIRNSIKKSYTLNKQSGCNYLG